MNAKIHISGAGSTAAGQSSQSRVYQNVTYTSAQGTKERPHPPPIIYENPYPNQLAEGIQLLNSQSWVEASKKLLEAVGCAPISVNSKHMAGIAFHMVSLNQPMTSRTVVVPSGCCSTSELSVPDFETFEKNRLDNLNLAKRLLADAYSQSVQLSPNIRSQIAFSYAMVTQTFGDDDLKRALITRAVELDRDNLDALAVKEGQDRPEFHTHVAVQANATAHASAHASAVSRATAYNRN
jgi:hypothetical protein